ncbi:MAG TPA: hypothetical protein VKT76_18820 [Bradyrhizobium sp.]|nr:hypothetical protein [Bradyrhizobium sp.]
MRVALALMIWAETAFAAWAGSTGPVIVIPGRPGVPIIINGVDASYSVVEGDWGLGKGIHVQPTVYGGHPIEPVPPVGHYYPSSGRLPGYGRLEIEPPGPPKPAESFHQSWSANSKQADPAVPANPPPVIVAPPVVQGQFQREFAKPPEDLKASKPR